MLNEAQAKFLRGLVTLRDMQRRGDPAIEEEALRFDAFEEEHDLTITRRRDEMQKQAKTICAACDKPLSLTYVQKFLAPLPATPENIEAAGVTCSSCTRLFAEWIAEQPEYPKRDIVVGYVSDGQGTWTPIRTGGS